jgi:hypothetical protein
MSVSLTDIVTKTRFLIEDNSKSTEDVFSYTTSSVFSLEESNPISVSLVYKNDVELDSGDWSYDSDTEKVTVTASLSSGDTIKISYSYYPNYTDSEIQNYIQGALVYISADNYRTWVVRDSTIYPEPLIREQNLIALITALVIDKPINTYRLPDITLTFPDDLPLQEKISKTISIFKRNKTGEFFVA